jgi:hypothetical protein
MEDPHSADPEPLLVGNRRSWVRAVAVLDSRRVVSGSFDKTLRLWDVESGKVECLFTLDAPVTALAVLPDRRIIVAGDGSGRGFTSSTSSMVAIRWMPEQCPAPPRADADSRAGRRGLRPGVLVRRETLLDFQETFFVHQEGFPSASPVPHSK